MLGLVYGICHELLAIMAKPWGISRRVVRTQRQFRRMNSDIVAHNYHIRTVHLDIIKVLFIHQLTP